jgi:CRP/FNR family transcriptional regulator, cyclic AMP receptor protein
MASPTPAELAAIPVFQSVATAELEEMAQFFTVRSYPKDAILATEGDQLDMFNIILSGRIQWFWSAEDGRQLKLQPEGPGGHFADTTLGGEPILMSIVALEPLRVASIPTAELKRLLLRHPQVAVELLMDVVARLRRTLRATKTLSMDEVYGRVVKLLLARAVESHGALVAEHLTHAEIGQRVGATREMVGRVLRDLARGGYIENARGRITILRKPPRRW